MLTTVASVNPAMAKAMKYGGDAEKALANVEDAIERKVDLFVEFFSDPEVNGDIGGKLKTAGIPAPNARSGGT